MSIHLLVPLFLYEIMWFIVIYPYWTTVSSTQYWAELTLIHKVALFLTFLELCVKCVLIVLFFVQYNSAFPNRISDILQFSYKMEEEIKIQSLNTSESNKPTEDNANKRFSRFKHQQKDF